MQQVGVDHPVPQTDYADALQRHLQALVSDLQPFLILALLRAITKDLDEPVC